MASYEQLRSYFSRSKELQTAARSAAEYSIVQGFVLDVDPLWCLLYDVENGLADWSTDFALRTWWRILTRLPHPSFWTTSYALWPLIGIRATESVIYTKR